MTVFSMPASLPGFMLARLGCQRGPVQRGDVDALQSTNTAMHTLSLSCCLEQHPLRAIPEGIYLAGHFGH